MKGTLDDHWDTQARDSQAQGQTISYALPSPARAQGAQ